MRSNSAADSTKSPLSKHHVMRSADHFLRHYRRIASADFRFFKQQPSGFHAFALPWL